MKIGLLGCGTMGAALAARLLLLPECKSLIVFNRNKNRLDALVDKNQAGRKLQVTTAIEEALAHADVLFVLLSDYLAICQVLLPQAIEKSSSLLDGKLVVQMSTIGVAESRELAERFSQLHCRYLEAPVLGSVPQVEQGSLQLFLSGFAADISQIAAILAFLGSPIEVSNCGEFGKAAAVKLAMNQLIAMLTTAFVSSLALVEQEHVSVELFMEILRKSALYAPTFDKKLQRMLSHDFSAGQFSLKHLLKDVRLFCEASEKHSLDTRVQQAVINLGEKGRDLQCTECDYSVLRFLVDRSQGSE